MIINGTRLLQFIFFIFLTSGLHAQGLQDMLKGDSTVQGYSADSTRKPKSTDTVKVDSTLLEKFPISEVGTSLYGSTVRSYIDSHPYYKASAPARKMENGRRQVPRSDWIFYLFTVSLGFFGIIRMSFTRYMDDLFKVFFNRVLRQNQLREQLAQNSIPSLLMNIFSILSGGTFLYFLDLAGVRIHNGESWRTLCLYVLGLFVLYVGKYLLIRFAGWLTGKKEVAAGYIFIVFMINKMAGIFLIPMSIMLAFSTSNNRQPFFIISMILLGILIIFRSTKAFGYLRKELKINVLHFIFYVFSCEVLPILVLEKALRGLIL